MWYWQHLRYKSSHISLVVAAVLDSIYLDSMPMGMGGWLSRVEGKLIKGEVVKELRS